MNHVKRYRYTQQIGGQDSKGLRHGGRDTTGPRNTYMGGEKTRHYKRILADSRVLHKSDIRSVRAIITTDPQVSRIPRAWHPYRAPLSPRP